jgi:murein DD-endopeptidase MepM/ murein hydrolase activator NlpD
MFIWAVVALVAILLAVRLLGARDVPRFGSAEDVVGLLRVGRPDLTTDDVTISRDGLAAVAARPGESAVTVAFVAGNERASREIRNGDLAAVDVRDGDGRLEVVLRTHDFGLPRVRLLLGAQDWKQWETRLRRLVGILAIWIPASAQGAEGPCLDSLRARIDPPSPKPGAFFQVSVERPPPGLEGDVAGERLHFRADSSGHLTAVAGVPVDAKGPQSVRLWCRSQPAETTTVDIHLGPGNYPSEQLRVDPRFVARPDSLLALRIAKESARAAEVATASHLTPRLWTVPFQRPRPSRVTSGYGRVRLFNGAVNSRHLGTDFGGLVGAPVRAVNRGVVRIVDAFYYGGNVVYLDHGEGLTTAYLHLSRHRVVEGDTVERGQVIGEVGATGRVTGPHLHLIARFGRLNLDPLSLLRVLGPPVKAP